MSDRRLIVLKFGGSVLRDRDTLRLAVHEIHRWRRADHRVVAVVSALAGVTEALLQRCAAGSDHQVAAIAATGELDCAALLGQLLDRAGVPARVLPPAALNLVATGPALDANPQSLDPTPIEAALAADEVAVVPGFTAVDPTGRTVVLGRGGSDLTALFLARHLHATRCRLIKDVDGLYEWDPAADGPDPRGPRRYAEVSWATALATDGAILQHKAVGFACAGNQRFEVGTFNGREPTAVGADRSRFESRRRPPAQPLGRPLRVALLGLGTVGSGLWQLLTGLRDRFEPTSVLVRDLTRRRTCTVDGSLLTTDGAAAVAHADIVVDAMGGTTTAQVLTARALAQGAHVVTANKALLASPAGAELAQQADAAGLRLLHSAAVGGCTPLLERLRGVRDVRCIRGVLNGTVNFVLDALAAGESLEEAMTEARRRGFAEADSTRDLSGADAADKLVLVARTLGTELDFADVDCEGVDAATGSRALAAVASGRRLRQVATLWCEGGRARARVGLEYLGPTDPLAPVHGEHNGAILQRTDGRQEVVRGKGAGRWPTAEALMGDLLQLEREFRGQGAAPATIMSGPERLVPTGRTARAN